MLKQVKVLSVQYLTEWNDILAAIETRIRMWNGKVIFNQDDCD